MIRWPLFIIGLGLIVCAFVAKVRQPPLATAARRVTVAEAVALVRDSAKCFVELEARVATDRKIYSTGDEVSKPGFTINPPDQVYAIKLSDLESVEVEKYLGNMVRVEAGRESLYLRLQMVRDRAFEEKQVMSERLLASIQGSSLRLWALSDALPSDGPEAKRWLSQQQFQGYLTRWKDVHANRSRPKFSHDLQKIYQFAEKEYGRPVPDNAYLLLSDSKSFPQPVSYFYCPVRDSQETLFCELTSVTATNVPTVLRGVLEPSKLELYQDFEKALRTKLPARIGILSLESAESFNQRAASKLREVFATGAGLALIGLIGIAWKAVRRSRQRAKG